MKRSVLFFLIFLTLPGISFSQIDHWESLVLEGDNFKYIVPVSQPPASWITQGFDDSSWNNGSSGFGYGDGDDQTQLSAGTMSVYIRTRFTVNDLSAIEQLYLHMDYDDGFIAYLNGVEVARNQLSGSPPAFDQPSDDQHEALLYQGLVPDGFLIDSGLILNGDNVLAVQVHNIGSGSSDLTAIPVLSVGISNSSFTYRNTPSWFEPPFEFYASELPVVVVNTNGLSIPNEPKIPATFGIIYNGEGQINRITDPWNEYNGHCGIELRGESSLGFEKKSYGIETWDEAGNDVDAAFLNFPEEEDFILYGPYSDKTLLNNVLAMRLGTEMGHYASRTRLVELVLNQDYLGVYVLMERIKVEDTRLDIAKLNPDEISGDDLTGGYILRIDKGNFAGFTSLYNAYNSNNKIFFQYFYPDGDEIVAEQRNYIRNYVTDFERAMASGNHRNNQGKHYTEYIDLRSFVDTFILNELSKNVDAYRLSTYFYKDKDSKGGKLNAGPLWDFNLSFGNGDYCGGFETSGYEYYDCAGSSPFWWDRMLKDTLFTNALSCRWTSLRERLLHPDSLDQYIDSMVASMPDAIERNFQRWQTLGVYLWPNPDYFAYAQTHAQVIAAMKNWIRLRGVWLDAALSKSVNDCGYYENFTHVPRNPVTGLEDALPQFIVFPNPSHGDLTIQGNEIINSIRLIDQQGRKVFELKGLTRTSLTINPHVSKGAYILLIETNLHSIRIPIIQIQ